MSPEPAIKQLNFDGTPFHPEDAPQPEQQGTLQRLGEMATTAVLRAQIATCDTLDHLKQYGARIFARGVLAGLALGGAAGFMDYEPVDAGYANYAAHTEAPLYLHPSSPTVHSATSEVMPNPRSAQRGIEELTRVG